MHFFCMIDSLNTEIVLLALKAAAKENLTDEWSRRVVLPLLGPGNPSSVREAAAEVLSHGEPNRDWAVEPLLTNLTEAVVSSLHRKAGTRAQTPIWTFAMALGDLGSPRAVPTMIGLIKADNTYDTVYGIGWFGLNKITGVEYDEKHDGAWWQQWWEKNKLRYSASVQALEIPRFMATNSLPSTQVDPDEDRDVGDVKTLEHFADGDTNKLYFLIAQAGSLAESSKEPHPLMLVLPGGDGGRDFQPFVKRICKFALPEGYLVAELVAPKWDENQFAQLVWPTEKNRYPGMKFSTEEFVRAVVADVQKKHHLDTNRIFSLGWSSGGPPTYAVSLAPASPVTGSFVAMSVFHPATLPDLKDARGKAYYILHSPEDFIPLHQAEQARDALIEHGATVRLQTYAGGHGWQGDPFKLIRDGVEWLSK